MNMGNMREISIEECNAVFGGTITVTGRKLKPGSNVDTFYGDCFIFSYFDEYGNFHEGGGEGFGAEYDPDTADTDGDKMTDAEKEKLTTTLEGLKAILEENIKKYKGDAVLVLADGTKVKATDVLDALGKTIDLFESANIAWDIVNKNADAIEVAAFVASIAGGAVAGALGAGPIAVFVASTAAGIATKEGLEFFDQQWDKAWEEAFVAVSDPGGNQTENMVKFFKDLFGSPSNPFNDNPFDGDPFGYYNGPGYKNWIA